MFCPVCGGRTTSQRVVERGCCYRCSKHPPQGFELTGTAKERAIAEFMAWCGDKTPSERIAEEIDTANQRLAGSAIARLQIACKRHGRGRDPEPAGRGTER